MAEFQHWSCLALATLDNGMCCQKCRTDHWPHTYTHTHTQSDTEHNSTSQALPRHRRTFEAKWHTKHAMARPLKWGIHPPPQHTHTHTRRISLGTEGASVRCMHKLADQFGIRWSWEQPLNLHPQSHTGGAAHIHSVSVTEFRHDGGQSLHGLSGLRVRATIA